MSAPVARRGFLRGLTTLPLVGGGVALLGAPTAVAAPVTRELLAVYADWLKLERRILLYELFPDPEMRAFALNGYCAGRAGDRFHLPIGADWRKLPQPSTRAALVLSAVGCGWEERP